MIVLTIAQNVGGRTCSGDFICRSWRLEQGWLVLTSEDGHEAFFSPGHVETFHVKRPVTPRPMPEGGWRFGDG